MARVTDVIIGNPLPPLPHRVVLELTGEEALYLRNLTGWYVTGSGPHRGSNSAIWTALTEVPGLSSGRIPAGIEGEIVLS